MPICFVNSSPAAARLSLTHRSSLRSNPPQDILPISADFAGKNRFSFVWFYLFAMSANLGKRKLIDSALGAITADPKQSP